MGRRRRARRPFALIVLVLTLSLCCSVSAAEARGVLLIDPGDELERAARAALEPWQVEVSVVSAASPGSSAPLLHERADAIARQHGAATVVWVSEHEAGYALWVYDAASRRVVARPLSATPPFAGPQAAAVALTLKTLLRHSESAPPEERYGASAPVSNATTPVVPAPSAQALDLSERPPPRREPRGASHVEPDASLALRYGFAKPSSSELRGGFGVLIWPRAKLGGIVLRGTFGPNLRVSERDFAGSLSSITLSAGGRVRWEPLRWLRVGAGVTGLLDVTHLQGSALLAQQRLPDQRHIVPGAAFELEIAWLALPWLRIGLRGSPAWLVRPQRYWLDEKRAVKILELSNVAYEAALVLGFGDHDP
jgi:hypothetical protein